LFEDLGRADIPGVNDVFRSAQRFDGLKTQQTMSVRNDADQDGFLDCPLDLQR
jgi:hypothetical protein